jgi:hypothetical protein
MSQTGEETQRAKLADTVVEEILKAYYSKLIEAPDRERARALNGFTVASGISAALVAAGLARGIGDAPVHLQAMALTSLILWLGACGAYLVAVGWSRGKRRPSSPTTDPNEAAWQRIDETTQALTPIRRASGLAQILSLLALLATALLISSALLGGEGKAGATVLLTRDGARQISAICDQGPAGSGRERGIEVRLDPDDLGGEFTEIAFAAGDCLGRPEELRIRTKTIQLLVAAEGD